MKFFIPRIDEKQTQTVLNSIKKNIEENSGSNLINKKIFKLTYTFEDKEYTAEVGKVEPRQNEEVLAILETSSKYLVCTINRGVVRGSPIQHNKKEVGPVEYFDE
jgi:hypothetical protein